MRTIKRWKIQIADGSYVHADYLSRGDAERGLEQLRQTSSQLELDEFQPYIVLADENVPENLRCPRCHTDDMTHYTPRGCTECGYEGSWEPFVEPVQVTLEELHTELNPENLDSIWDGICVACSHDYYHDCHGDCTCLSCNAQRQADERYAAEHNVKILL